MMRLTKILLSLFVLLSLNSALYSATYYVDATNGNDSNGGLAENSAWRTINKVNNTILQPGDFVLFKRGETFTGYTLVPSRSGTSGSPITFGAYGSGNKPIFDGQNSRVLIQSDNRDYIVYDNLHIYNGNNRGFALLNSDHVTISNSMADGNHNSFQVAYLHGNNYHIINSTFKNAGIEHGIYMDGGDNSIVEYSTFTDNNMNGLKFNVGWTGEHAESPIVRYNWFENNETGIHDQSTLNAMIYYNVIIMRPNAWSTGISLSYEAEHYSYAPRNARIFNNTFFNNDVGNRDNAMIYVYSNPNNTGHIVRNNIFYNHHTTNGYASIVNSGAGTITFDNNLYYKNNNGTNYWHWKGTTYNSLTAWKSASGSDASSIVSNPGFEDVAGYDFTLTSASNAIDHGTDLGFTQDYTGNSIYNNPDAGAFEFQEDAPPPPLGVKLSVNLILSGAYNGNSHLTSLVSRSFFPNEHPYNTGPWNYSGNETYSGSSENIVDWLLIELRETTAASSLVGKQAVLLTSDGNMIDVNGNSGVSFEDVAPGDYYVVVYHRNHLSIMSANKLSLSSTAISYDFTTAQNKAFGANPMADLGNGKYGLIPGDANADGTISDTDISDVWLNQFLNAKDEYQAGDLNLDGSVTSSDNNEIWLNNKNKSTSVPN